MKATSTLIALAFALSMPFATAAPDGTAPKKKADPAKIFKRKDKDHDSLLSKDEFEKGGREAAKADKIFGRKDKNNDGKLTFAEFTAVPKKKHKKATE
ncbi:hypothetical protein [Luteolibacter soli]|uniref:EF-hand domain-containing protein n=1 Tax=Luteolibacter soli TaxID=3135280 RepID=A0ABU9AW94_9BACT